MRAACYLYPGSLLPEPNAGGAKHSCHLLRADEERGFFSGTLRCLRISPVPHGAEATMSAVVNAWPWIPQPPSGDCVMSTQVLFARCSIACWRSDAVG